MYDDEWMLQMMFTFNVPHTTTPELLISMILQKKAITLNSKGEHVSEFALKACGREEYLVGDYPLIRFLYIQEALSQDATPSLVIISVHKIPGMYWYCDHIFVELTPNFQWER